MLIEVSYSKGVHVPELDLWLDPGRAKPWAFVSHAHFDHFGRHQRVICSEVNAKLMRARFGISEDRLEPHEFGVPWEEEGFRFELLPAGHIFGSAMIHLTRLRDGATLLYTGDFKLRQGLAAEVCELREAEVLITETTFGLSRYVLPPEEEIRASIVEFVRSCFKDGVVPILCGYSLGKAQEAIALLEREGIDCLQHKTVAAMTNACRSAGLPLAEPRIFEEEIPSHSVLVCAPNTMKSRWVQKMKDKRSAMLTGWAMNANAHYRYRTDAAFPLTDHADHPDLLKAVQEVKPKLVWTLHGSSREFARDLRALGIEAWSIYGNDQLELALTPST